jgi:hypothetical protein
MRKGPFFSSVLTIALTSGILSATPLPPDNYQISTPNSQLQNEEQVWYHPDDSNIIIADWRDFRLGYRQIGVGRSDDAGNNWVDSLVDPFHQLYNRQSDPTLTIDGDGNFYLCFLDYSADIPDLSTITFIKSIDKGISWGDPHEVLSPTGISFEDKQFITTDRTSGTNRGNIYVAWARFPNPTQIMFARSIGGTLIFDDPIVVGPPYSYSNKCGSHSGYDAGQFAFPFVGADGSVYVAWIGPTVDTTDCRFYDAIKFVKSTNGGESFSEPSIIRHVFGNYGYVDGSIDVYNAPIAAADISGGPFSGNIYIAYANSDTKNYIYYDYNIEFIRSVDGGATWSDPIYINDDATGLGAMYDQFHPWLIVNEEGILIAIFYDQRTDSTYHYKFDVFASYSYDGGLTFTTNCRISDISINPSWLAMTASDQAIGSKSAKIATKSQSIMAGKIAEYIGVTAYYDRITAVWTDTRNGNQDVFGANWPLSILEPKLLSPQNNDSLSSDTLQFRWATSWKNDDDRYRLEFSRDSMFGTILFQTISDTNSVLMANQKLSWGDYYWRVKCFSISNGDSSIYSAGRLFFKVFICGDANTDSKVNLLDISYIIRNLYYGGPAPLPPQAADVNHSGTINLLDVSYIINYLYRSGPTPSCPQP